MYKVYLVDDEENLNNVLTSYLKNEEWDVTSFVNGTDAMNHIVDEPDLWILDIMLPDIDGYQLIKKIKDNKEDTPVIFISARDADLDRVIGLEMGSEDYLAKPFMPRELVIRAKKLLERVYGQKVDDKKQKMVLGTYEIDMDRRMVMIEGNMLDLTSKEFDILELFINNMGHAFSREQILDDVWGDDYFGSDRVVDDLVRRLRKKMPELNVETMYGFGYRMTK